ncbi:MAG: hypothetical protein ACKPKO_46910, partial [Candidatus Fonsibacter sp.]
MAALTALQFPEALTKPFRDIIEERTAAEQQKVDHGKLYVQLCHLKNQKVKLRDVVKFEVEALQKQLDAKSNVLADYTHDVEQLQAQVNSMLAEAACSVTVPKRASDTVQGLQAVKLYLNQDDNALATSEYLQYRAEATAKGSAVLGPLRVALAHGGRFAR